MKGKINYTQISRLFFLAFLLFVQVLTSFYNNVGIGYVLIFLALLFQIASDKLFLKGRTYLWLVAFAVFCFASSTFVAVDREKAYTYILVFLEYTAIFYLIHRYSEEDGNINFAITAFIILSVVMAVVSMFFGRSQLRISFSENINSNTIGVVCAFGMAFLLFRFIHEEKTMGRIILIVAILLLLAFVVVRTASKKSIITGAVLILLWIVFCYKQAFGNKNAVSRILTFSFIILISYLAYKWFVKEESAAVEYLMFRFGRLNANDGGSTEERIDLIKEGLNVFSTHFLLGVGFNNFRFYNSYNTYAHNLYIELLSSCGIIGTLIFLAPIIRSLSGYRKLLYRGWKNERLQHTEHLYMLIIFLALLFLSFTQIIFYELPLMYIYGVTTAYISISSNDLYDNREVFIEDHQVRK